MSAELLEVVLEEAEQKMDKAVGFTRAEFSTVRTGRASPALVEKLAVEAYGEQLPLQQLAGFSVPEARTLLILPYDKSNMNAIERAIRNSDLGLNPSNDGVTLRLTFPQLTQERRRELVRLVKGMAEDGRVAIRNTRREARKEFDQLRHDGDVSEDDVARATKELDGLTHRLEAAIDGALADKEQELLEV